jgi:hypothetical protein
MSQRLRSPFGRITPEPEKCMMSNIIAVGQESILTNFLPDLNAAPLNEGTPGARSTNIDFALIEPPRERV